MKFDIPTLNIQLFIKNNHKSVIAVLVILGVILFGVVVKWLEKPKYIEPPTQQDYEEAAKIRQKDCDCWDSVIGVCLPVQVCQIREREED